MPITTSLSTLTNLQNQATAVTLINGNSELIETAFSSAVNVTGDIMQGNLDMNSNQILNLPAPASAQSPVRLMDINSTASATPAILSGSNVYTGNNSFTATTNFNTIASATSLTASSINAGSISASSISVTALTLATFTTTTLNASSISTTTFTATVGNIDTITSTTINASNITTSSLTLSTSFTTVAAAVTGSLSVGTLTVSSTFTPLSGIVGTATVSNASTGNVGEYLVNTLTSVGATTMTTTTAQAIISLDLTAGDWDLHGSPGFSGGATTVNYISAMITTSSATINASPGVYVGFAPAIGNFVTGLSTAVPGAIGPVRVSVGTTTTYYLNGYCVFQGGSLTGFGQLEARRVR